MTSTPTSLRYRLHRIIMLACVALSSPAAFAQPITVTYDLIDVWLLPDISHPGQAARQMFGTYEWTYDVGDFENGSGQFTDLSLPWYNPIIGDLNINIDLTSIEFTLPGNFHDLGVDVTLRLPQPFAPDQPRLIDTTFSLFEIQYGVSHHGHVISGSIVPRSTCPADVNSDGEVDTDDFLAVLVNWGPCIAP